MSYLHQEDWVHIDDYNKEVDPLKDKIQELQTVIDDMKYDEAYVLSWIMGLRNNARNRKEWETVAHCDHIINLHSAVAQAQAHQMRSE